MTTLKLSKLNKFVCVSVYMALLSTLSVPALAQIEQQTGIADPGRLEKSLSERKLIPQVTPDVKVQKLSVIEAPEGAENIKFNFGGLQLEGANIYTEEELISLYGNMIGTEITLADLYAIANRITLKYRNNGYILTQVVVPPQTIENGIARLQVVEGFIENIIIQGDDQSLSELKTIEQYAGRISKGGALNIKSMERYLLLINDLPGLTARSVITPSETTQGAADIVIIVERDPFEAFIGANNHGSRFLGPFQFNAATQFNSYLGLNESISLQTVVTAPDAGYELVFGSIRYDQPIGPWGTKLSFTGGISETDPGFTLSQFDVEGLSRSLSFQATHPIIRSRSTNVLGRVMFDWRNVESQNSFDPTLEDRIRAIRTGVRTDFIDTVLGTAVNTLDLEISQGIDVLGSSDEGDANLSRPDGDPTFTKANLQIQRLQRLTNSFNLLLSGRGQWSNKPLLSSEEFSLGGISSVRGFEPSEIIGDDGIYGTIEVQWNSPSRTTQVFGFLDSGTVWDQDSTTSDGKRNSLSATGFGVRFDLPMQVDAEFIASQPLNRDIETQSERDPQFFFSVNKKF